MWGFWDWAFGLSWLAMIVYSYYQYRARAFYQNIVHQHNLCHDLHSKVGVNEFAQGCIQEQIKLYGCSTDRDKIIALKGQLQLLQSQLLQVTNERDMLVQSAQLGGISPRKKSARTMWDAKE